MEETKVNFDNIEAHSGETESTTRGKERNSPNKEEMESTCREEERQSPDNKNGMLYKVTDRTSPHLSLVFGLQQVFLSISSTISVPLVTAGAICAGNVDLAKSEILSTFLFMCGISTILQTFVGVRLPILQGGSHKFIPAILAMMSLERWECPDMTRLDPTNNVTSGLSDNEIEEIWTSRMLELQGGILTASVIQFVIGCTGMIGLLLQYVGPITILPTITLIGLSLVDVALLFCGKHWGISSLTIALVLIFSLYLGEVRVPLPSYSRQKKCHITKYPVFKLLPVILAVMISWVLCGILTATDTFSKAPGTSAYNARTDSRTNALSSASWFFFPYPGQWGRPTVSVSGFVAMLTSTIASIVESVGDYHACARISGEIPPPEHAVNRGIVMEGLGSIVSGAIGSGGASTSYSQNVGAIGFTKVASRRAFITAGIIFVVAGMCGKFGALLTTIPDPILGGILLVSFGMVTSVGLSNLQFVSMESTRNMVIIGVSILVGLMVPRYLTQNPGCIQTGNSDLDQVLTVLLSTSMFIGGLLGFILDNSVPGTDEERGIKSWRQQSGSNTQKAEDRSESLKVYDLPYISGWLGRQRWSPYVPFLPTYKPRTCRTRSCCK